MCSPSASRFSMKCFLAYLVIWAFPSTRTTLAIHHCSFPSGVSAHTFRDELCVWMSQISSYWVTQTSPNRSATFTFPCSEGRCELVESGHVQKALQDNQGVLLSSICASTKGPNTYLNQRFVFVVFNKLATTKKERRTALHFCDGLLCANYWLKKNISL